jgi:hypothetical protein
MNKKTCISTGNENVNCPNCGKEYHAVEYYTARPIQQETVRQDLYTNKIITTYTDVNRHFGKICLSCAYENEKSKRIVGLVLLIVGGAGSAIAMVTGLIQSNIAEARGENIGAAMGTSMALMGVLVIVGVIGLSVFVGANALRNLKAWDQEGLNSLFVRYVKKESPQSGIMYLSPGLAAQLKIKSFM